MKPSRILLILDDPVTTQLIKFPLERDAHTLFIVSSPKQALRLLKKEGLPHFVISAIHFATKMDGFRFCQKLHKFCAVPVLFLVDEADTADHTLISRIEKYAQGCLIRPDKTVLSPNQIVTAVQTLEADHGRFPHPLQPLIPIDNHLTIHFTHRYALLDEEKVSLTPTETKLLYLLIHHINHTIPTAALLHALWPHETASEERLHTHIYRLRKKIEPDYKTPSHILSDWNVGYKFSPRSEMPLPHLLDEATV